MRRRDFLRGSAAALAAGSLVRPGLARASWGVGPDEAQKHLLPVGVRAESVLELFLYGGLAPFESFYVVPEYGQPNDPDYANQQWHLFADDHQRIYGTQCGLSEPSTWLQPWATDALGMSVNLGPVAWPLRQ